VWRDHNCERASGHRTLVLITIKPAAARA